MLSAKNHENLTETSQIYWEKEKWYGTEYAIRKFSSDMLEVSSHVIINSVERSLEYSAGSHSRAAPPAPQPLYTEEFPGDPGWCFHGERDTSRNCVKGRDTFVRLQHSRLVYRRRIR